MPFKGALFTRLPVLVLLLGIILSIANQLKRIQQIGQPVKMTEPIIEKGQPENALNTLSKNEELLKQELISRLKINLTQMQPQNNQNDPYNTDTSDSKNEHLGLPSPFNKNCVDDPESFLGISNICNEIKQRGGEGCDGELSTHDVVANDVADADGKLVITIGSRYCPETCNAVSQCIRARKHFIYINTRKSSSENKKQKIHFRTYGNDVYAGARKRIVNEANATGWFATAKYGTPETLSMDFQEKYKEILELRRGGGYWIWKLYIIEQTMANEMSEGDFLVYLDAGHHVNKGGEKRFFEYIKMVGDSKYDMLGFQIHPNLLEHKWTTNRVFDAFNVTAKDDRGITHSAQLESGTLLFQKGPHYQKWMEMCKSIIDIDPWMITDKYNEEAKKFNPAFKENRHDQSIMSVARKKLGYVRIDGTESKNAQPDKPFHVMRKRD